MMANRVELEIVEDSPFAGGAVFGPTGSYRKLSGRAHFVVDPTAESAAITDLANAPRASDGNVRFAADFCILVPEARGNGNLRLLFEWCNRGNKLALQFFNDSGAANDPITLNDAGNGFLFRRGYAVAWLAWQGDLLPGDGRMLIDVPTASGPSGPISGRVRREFIVEQEGTKTLPLSGSVATMSYPTVSLDPAGAVLTRRPYPKDARITVSPKKWRFAREERLHPLNPRDAEYALIPSRRHIHLEDGFEPGHIYELVYTARDPLVLGLGFVAAREFLTYLRSDPDKGNPLAGAIEKVYGWGHSQSARAMREFIYRGFNDRGDRKPVFDGVIVHGSGAGRMWLNHRFANGSSMAGQQYEEHYNVADRFPFAYASTTDESTGRSDAILKRPETDPLIIHVQTSSEYWQRRGSLLHTDTRGNDLQQPRGVRIYHLASSQHFATATMPQTTYGVGQFPPNDLATHFFVRALFDALDRWASEGTEPPASRIPTRSDGTLVEYSTWKQQFPSIPGIAIPSAPNALPLLDFGPDEERGILTKEPPEIIEENGYPVMVPSVDADGNEIAGLRAPDVAVPVATLTGWNLRATGHGRGALYRFTGARIPFSRTESERSMTGDPRCAIAVRYPNEEAFRRAIEAAVALLHKARYLLDEDVERLLT